MLEKSVHKPEVTTIDSSKQEELQILEDADTEDDVSEFEILNNSKP